MLTVPETSFTRHEPHVPERRAHVIKNLYRFESAPFTSANCSRGRWLPVFAFATIKLPSTDICSPRTRPALMRLSKIRSNIS